MLDTLLAVLTGGAGGLIGTAISVGTRFLESRQKHRQELELRKIDLALQKIETESAERRQAFELESAERRQAFELESAERRRAAELESETIRADQQALQGSYQVAGTRWSTGESKGLVFVDVVRGLTRPTLTILFLALTAAIYFTVADGSVREQIVHTVLSLTTTCVVWWFGTRRAAIPPR